MAQNTKISWAHHTFNPWIGCTKISPGCRNCYAQLYAQKYKMAQWGEANPRRLTADSTWQKPLLWNKQAQKNKIRYRVFCASLADVFENNIQLIEWQLRLFDLIEQTPHLDWLLLTKRPQNIEKLMPNKWKISGFPKNVWLGTTICTQSEYDNLYPILQDTGQKHNAKLIFVSFEPLLEPIILHKGYYPDWAIIGGESGFLKVARVMHLQWVHLLLIQIRQNSKKSKVFVKQIGTHLSHQFGFFKMDPKGEFCIEKLPSNFDWLKIRQIP